MDYGYGGTTTYGAQGGAADGGFLGGSQAGSQDTSGGKSYGQDTLRPVTVKQLLDATFPYSDSEPKIDNKTVSQAHFIGLVRVVSAQTTNITFKVDDGTGTIDVKQWIDSDAGAEDEKFIPKEGDYIHVYGKLKEFNNKRHVAPQAIRPVTDFNELNYHLLSATAVHLYFTQGPPEKLNAVKTEGQEGLFVDGHGGGAPGGKKLPIGLSPMARKVYELLENTPQNSEGLHVHEIARQLNAASSEVFKSGDELIQHSLIFTTIDDETWAVLE